MNHLQRLRHSPREGWAWGLTLLALGVIALGLVRMLQHLQIPGLVGFLQDDAEYVLYAFALANGQGYVDISQPGHPIASRFPIGFSALLVPAIAGVTQPIALAVRAQTVMLVASVAYLLACFATLRCDAHWRLPAAVLGAGLLVTYPGYLNYAALVAPDAPFAALVLALVLALRRGMAARGGWACSPAATGVYTAGVLLIRYAGAPLAIAAAVGWGVARGRRASASYLASCALALLPWGLFRLAAGDNSYAEHASNWLPKTPAEGLMHAQVAFDHLLVFFGAWAGAVWNRPLVPWAGALVLTLVAVGVRRAWQGGDRLGPLFLGLTLGMAVAYDAIFSWYGEELIARLAFPLYPLMLVALWQGLRGLWPFGRRGLEGLALAALLAGSLSHVGWQLRVLARPPLGAPAASVAEDYFAMFRFVQAHVPLQTPVCATFGPMTTLYTSRTCSSIPMVTGSSTRLPGPPPPAIFRQFLVETGVKFLVGTPEVDPDTHRDLIAPAINALVKADPSWLEPRYVNARHNVVVFALDPAGQEAAPGAVRPRR